MEKQTSTESQNKSDMSAQNNLQKKSTFGKKVIAFLLMVVLALIAGGFLSYQYFIKPLVNENQNLKTTLSGLKINDQSGQKTLQALQQTVLANQKAVSNITRRFYQQPNGWTLIEVTQLIRLAHLKLKLENNIPATIHLLQNAYNLLKTLNNPQYQPLQHALNQDITALENIKQPNIINIYLQLQALNTQPQKLNLIQPTKSKSIQKTTTTNQTAWNKSLATLKQVVIIQKHENAITPLLINDQQMNLVKLVIGLHIVQAQTALLQKNDLIYQKNLAAIKNLVQRYFSINMSVLNNWLDQIKALQKIRLNIQSVNIHNSLKVLQQTLSSQKTQHKL